MDEDAAERLLRERGYKIRHTLGEGAYSKVKSAYSMRLKKDVAIKCINTKIAPRDFVDKFLPRELQILPLVRHNNIVRVYEILEANGFIYIVMEAASNGDLLKYVQRHGALPEPEIRKYFWELCQAVDHCHAHNICHRDLKCENLLLDRRNKLLLTDFGFAKPLSFNSEGKLKPSSTFCGSAAYTAPEVIQGQPYDPRMQDIWSLGVILYIMSCGHMPFDDSNVKRMLKVQLRNRVSFPPGIGESTSVALKHLIRGLIQTDLTKRLTMEQLLRHQFFDELRVSDRPKPSSASVAQQIYDFLTGKPRTTKHKRGSSRSSDLSTASSSDGRKQRSKSKCH